MGITVVSFIYLWSISLWFVDATFFAEDPTLAPRTVDGAPLDTELLLNSEGSEGFRTAGEAALNTRNNGTVLDRLAQSVTVGTTATWTILELLTGTYAFNVLEDVGVHPNLVTVLKLMFPLIVAITVIYYVTGRQ